MEQRLQQNNRFTNLPREPQDFYLILICLIGTTVLVSGSLQIPTFEPKFTFFLLLILAAASHFTASTSPVASNKSAITYSIDPAIAIAAVPFFGLGGAVLIEAISDLVVWLIKPSDKFSWKRSGKQLAFNASMHIISISVAGLILLSTRNWLREDTIWRNTIPWILAAITNDQINIWLLIFMLRLQYGREINLLSIWKENLWAMPTGVLVMVIGGAILAFALSEFGTIGVLIFFLPIILSALADRSYVRQMRAHMDNLENIIDERTKELQNVLKEKDAFLAVLTHDMKTPLTSIGIYGELIQKHPDLIVQKPHMATIITQSQKTLLDIVNNILDLEKLSVDGSLPMEMENFDLVSTVEKVVETLRPQAMQKEIDLNTHLSPFLIIFHADRHQIERVMQNLISNAIKYTPQEGQVDITLTSSEEFITITVADTGYGIPEEEMPYVFDRFRRVAKHRNKAAGTGLGLAITQQLVKAQGGDITVTSTEGAGTTFTVRFPLPSNSNKTKY